MATSQKRSRPSAGQRPSPRGGGGDASRRARLAAEQAAAARAQRTRRIVTGALVGILVLVLGAVVVVAVRSMSTDQPTVTPGQGEVVRESSHRLTDPPTEAVTFVEFLDFECEACGAVFPAVEELRATYGDRVTFVVRYFPLPGHFNADRAARAVEAAAQQNQFEAMYRKMYQTQAEWGEQQVPKDDLFRQFAEELGLDMAQWDADYASEATKARIQVDIDDGTALGVTGTPAFFVNGQRLQPKSSTDLTAALDQALDQQ